MANAKSALNEFVQAHGLFSTYGSVRYELTERRADPPGFRARALWGPFSAESRELSRRKQDAEQAAARELLEQLGAAPARSNTAQKLSTSEPSLYSSSTFVADEKSRLNEIVQSNPRFPERGPVRYDVKELRSVPPTYRCTATWGPFSAESPTPCVRKIDAEQSAAAELAAFIEEGSGTSARTWSTAPGPQSNPVSARHAPFSMASINSNLPSVPSVHGAVKHIRVMTYAVYEDGFEKQISDTKIDTRL